MSPRPAPQEVRIIGGLYRRSKLAVADRPGLRPTPNRVRETLFNWLSHRFGNELAGCRCVDAFAGTGALGFEAASRGAADVLLVEQDAALLAALKAARDRLGAAQVRIERGDGVAALRRLAPGSVDIVFLDPPFESSLLPAALTAAAAALAARGCIYLEAAQSWSAAPALADTGLQLLRDMRAGAVYAHLLGRQAASDSMDIIPHPSSAVLP